MSTGRPSPAAMRKLAVAAIALVLVAVGWLWIQRHNGGEPTLRLYGNVDIREVQLNFRQPGRIAAMAFEEGDRVKAGAAMAVLDDGPLKDALAAADAAVAVAEAERDKLRNGLRPQEIVRAQEALRQARALATETDRNLQRQTGLLATGATSQRSVDAARAAQEQAAAGVNSARAALSQANEGARKEDIAAAESRLAATAAARAQAATALADATLRAPSPGTVLARVLEPGSMVTSQSHVYSLSLDRPVYVRAYVGETELGKIAPGTRVTVRSDSSNTVYHGQIGFISPRAEFTPKTVETTDLRTDLVYRLRIVIGDADAALLQGMPVTIDVDATADGATADRH